MPSAAASLLSTGFLVNREIHGESLGYLPPSKVQRQENGEAVTDEAGIPILLDGGVEDATTITGIFDEAHQFFSAEAVGMVTTAPAATVLDSDVPGVERGAIIIRDDVIYSVLVAEEPSVDGARVLRLSKHAQ